MPEIRQCRKCGGYYPDHGECPCDEPPLRSSDLLAGGGMRLTDDEMHGCCVVCVFCDVFSDPIRNRSEGVKLGWRTLKRKWICPRCMDVIRRAVALNS